jgi:hypothetical protein
MKLLYNSIEIKTEKLTDPISKLKAVIIIQLKVIMKYEEFITILLSQIWGNEPRHQYFRKYIYEYIDIVKCIIEDGIKTGKIKNGNSELIASMIFGAICSINIHKKKMNGEMDLVQLSNDIVEYAINGIVLQ